MSEQFELTAFRSPSSRIIARIQQRAKTAIDQEASDD